MDTETGTKPFDIDNLDALNEAKMTVIAGGVPTSWVWTFAGPGHPRADAQSERISRETLASNRLKEQAQVNGKKWKAPEQTADEILEKNVNYVLERLLDWTPVKLGGEEYAFSAENARKLLIDRKKGALLQQALDFLLDDASFTQRLSKT